MTKLKKCLIAGDDMNIISQEELNEYWNYITNLQEEVKSANESITWWSNRFKAVERDKKNYKLRNEKAIEFIKEKISSTKGVINDYMYHKEHNKILIELLQEDIELYKKELNILTGEKDES